ncbi:hypothetical protein [Ruegeria arenilitoris]|uniref:hypothetical protein n=1 Tax=Ruegeria arenilitoris TaxID=1173585 RepID=UPI00147B617F|nr:hypothetical protein [Ruegeria arenilitoris]
MSDFDVWLSTHRPDYQGVNDRLKSAIAHFVLIWSYFEQQVLAPADRRLLTQNAQAMLPNDVSNYDRIEEAASYGVNDFTTMMQFRRAYKYFSKRHLDGVHISAHLRELARRAVNSTNRIEQVFRDDPDDYTQRIAALLHIAYCLRTNLIHGFKWESGLVGQEVNFYHASQVLMLAVDYKMDPNEV